MTAAMPTPEMARVLRGRNEKFRERDFHSGENLVFALLEFYPDDFLARPISIAPRIRAAAARPSLERGRGV